jgi:WD40 repeat protein
MNSDDWWKYNITKLAWNPDSKLLAVNYDDGIIIWDVPNKKVRTHLRISKNVRFYKWCYNLSYHDLSWHPDGRDLLLNMSDMDNRARINIWNTHSNAVVKYICSIQRQDIEPIIWSPDGSHILSGSHKGVVSVWEKTNKAFQRKNQFFIGDEHLISSLAVSHNGCSVAVGTTENNIVDIDITRKREKQIIIMGPNRTKHEAKKSSQKNIFARFFDHPPCIAVTSLAYNPINSSIILTGHNSKYQHITMWNINSEEKILSLSGGINTHYDFQDPRICMEPPSRQHHPEPTIVGWSPDGSQFFSAGSDTLKIWDTEKHWELRTISRHLHAIQTAAWSPDGRYIATGAFGELIIWDSKNNSVFDLKPSEKI